MKTTYALALSTFAFLFLSVQPATAEYTGEWVSLFNGENLAGWRISENPASISVKDGEIVVHGPRAHAFYIGEHGHATFKNFHLKAKVKTTEGSNSGIYFHTKWLAEGWPDRGYEAQVNNTHGDPKKTGGLYSIVDVYEAPAKDGEWFDYDVIVTGKRIRILINGKETVDYTEPDDLDRPERQLDSGQFALQAHDPKSVVYFKEIKVLVLPD